MNDRYQEPFFAGDQSQLIETFANLVLALLRSCLDEVALSPKTPPDRW